MSDWLVQMYESIHNYYGDSIILLIYIVCLFLLCFLGARTRRMIVYPSIIITIIIINPVFYGLIWVKLLRYAYWRMLWIIPIIPVIAITILSLDGIFKSKNVSTILICFITIFVVLKSNNIYSKDEIFVEASNAYKLPDSTVTLGNIALKYHDSPTLIVPSSQYCYLRQYNGKIKQVFGRNAEWFIEIRDLSDSKWWNWWAIVELVNNNGGDSSKLIALAENFDTDIIVLYENHDFSDVESYGYEILARTDGFVLYSKDK